MGFFGGFSRRLKADSKAPQKRDSTVGFLTLEVLQLTEEGSVFLVPSAQARRGIWPESTLKISPDAPISVNAAGSAPVIQTCAPSVASSLKNPVRLAAARCAPTSP